MKNSFLLLKQSIKSLKKSKLSIILLSIFLVISSWLILGFSFLYTNLNSAINNLQTESNLATAMLSTKEDGSKNISYLPLDSQKEFSEKDKVKVLNPKLYDDDLLTDTLNGEKNKVLESLGTYYESIGLPKDSYKYFWSYISEPNAYNKNATASDFNYTSLALGTKAGYYYTVKNPGINKSKVADFVDIWTLYENGLPTDKDNKFLTNPNNFVIDQSTNTVKGLSYFDNAYVNGIDLDDRFEISHILFDVKENKPVIDTKYIPNDNNAYSDPKEGHISSPGTLSNIVATPSAWKKESNGQPNWGIATPLVQSNSLKGIYGRTYDSLCYQNTNLQATTKIRTYQIKLDTSKLNDFQKMLFGLVEPNLVDENIQQQLDEYKNQYNGDANFKRFLRNLKAIYSPEVSIQESVYSKGKNETNLVLNNVKNQLTEYYKTIENLAKNSASFLNNKTIKFIDIYENNNSIVNIANELGIDLDVTKFSYLQSISQSEDSYNAILINKSQDPKTNKVISNNYNLLFEFKKPFNYSELSTAFIDVLMYFKQFNGEKKVLENKWNSNKNQLIDGIKNIADSCYKTAWLLNEANFNGGLKKLDDVIQSLYYLSQPDKYQEEQIKTNLTTLVTSIMFNSITNNNGILELSFKAPGIGNNFSLWTPVSASYVDNNYAMVVVNDIWLEQNPSKEIIDEAKLNKLMNLPYDEFLTELSSLDKKYKVNLNGYDYIIVGKGISADFAYPMVNQYSFDKKRNVALYMNDLGFSYLKNVTHTETNVWYSIQPKNITRSTFNLDSINQKLSSLLNNQKFYLTDDANMPDKNLYQSVNYPRNLADQILVISLIVGIVTSVLSAIVLLMILGFIIKSNASWIGLGISNGQSKSTFIFVNWLSSLMLSWVIGVIAGLIVGFTYPLLTFFFYNQWTIPLTFMNVFWVIPVIIGILFLVIYLGSIIISLIVLNRRVLDLVAQKDKKKANWNLNISFTKSIGLGSLMNRYFIAKFAKVFAMMVIAVIITFIASASISLNSQFNNSYQQTIQNSNYSFATDLYSPSEQGGGYYLSDFDDVPTSENKPVLDIYKQGGAYNSSLEYITNPYTSEQLTNMWLPDESSLVSDVKTSITFLKDKLVNQLALNVSIDVSGNIINLWEFATNVFPTSVISFINDNTNTMLTSAFNFYMELDNNPKLRQAYFGEMKSNKIEDNKNPWTFDGKAIDPNNPENNMLFKTEENAWEWRIQGKNSVLASGLKKFKKEPLRLLTYLITNYQNPVFTNWCKENGYLVAKPYWLGLNQVSNEYLLDTNQDLYKSTYTYLEVSNGKNKFKVQGINSDNGYINLKDVNDSNKTLNHLLPMAEFDPKEFSNYEIPMVISEVGAKKHNLKVGDTLKLTINNHFNRYTWKFNNIANPYVDVIFKVVGINTDKLKDSYYIDQDVANKILGYDQLPQEQRFNGVYYKSNAPLGLLNLSTLYSPSGITTMAISYPTEYYQMNESPLRNSLVHNIFTMDFDKQEPIIDTIVKFDLTGRIFTYDYKYTSHGGETEAAIYAVKELNKIFGSTLIQSAITNLDSVALSQQFANTMDETISNFTILFIVCILPIMICINLLLITIMIEDINKILGLLLTQGYSKMKLIGTFSALIALWVLFGVIVGAGISTIIPTFFNSIIWTSMNIITNSSFTWMNWLITLGSFTLISLLTFVYSYYKLKKTPLLALLAGYNI